MPRKKNIHYKEQTLNICSCGIMTQVGTCTWANLGGNMVLLCWDCTDTIHKAELAKDARAASILNVDYIH